MYYLYCTTNSWNYSKTPCKCNNAQDCLSLSFLLNFAIMFPWYKFHLYADSGFLNFLYSVKCFNCCRSIVYNLRLFLLFYKNELNKKRSYFIATNYFIHFIENEKLLKKTNNFTRVCKSLTKRRDIFCDFSAADDRNVYCIGVLEFIFVQNHKIFEEVFKTAKSKNVERKKFIMYILQNKHYGDA